MNESISIGVDFGSTGVRVAWAADGGSPVVLPDAAAGRWPWLRCEAAPGRLGVAFPSLKSTLGTEAAVSLSRQPSELTTELFQAVKQAVETHTARSVAQAVISVPARYSASQRAALRDAVLAAHFAQVHFLNDTVAAVMASTAQRETATTVLVYGMGYAGFELGLVRAVRGHYRALGYEGGRTPAGWALDELLLQALLDVAREHQLVLDVAHWDSPMWMQVRAVAQRVKEELSASDHVPFYSIETADGKAVGTIAFARARFEEVVRPSFAATLGSAHTLLEQAGMTLGDVDAVLLVGGTTRIPLLQTLIEKELGKRPTCLHADDLARGAALYALRLEAKPFPAGQEVERAPDGEKEAGALPGIPAALRAEIEVKDANAVKPAGDDGQRLVLLASRGPGDAAAPDRQSFLRHASRLAEEGRVQEARTFLTDWIQEAQALLKALPAAPTKAASTDEILARRALARAQQLLKTGQLEEAVRESHLAWEQNGDDPDVFDQMIEVHCDAALASRKPEGYADAQRWLMCANQHDQGNGKVQQLLADRHYLQAKHLSDNGKRREALQTLELCLAWNPEHDKGRDLQAALRRRASSN